MNTFKGVIRGLIWALAIVLAVVVIRLARPGPAHHLVHQIPSPEAPLPPPGESPQPASEQPPPPQTTGQPPITGRPPLSMQKPKLNLNACEYYAKRGDYEEAVVCYRERQKLDPSNDFIRQKIEYIIKTCKKENEVMQMNLNCDPKQGVQPPATKPPEQSYAGGKRERDLEPGR